MARCNPGSGAVPFASNAPGHVLPERTPLILQEAKET